MPIGAMTVTVTVAVDVAVAVAVAVDVDVDVDVDVAVWLCCEVNGMLKAGTPRSVCAVRAVRAVRAVCALCAVCCVSHDMLKVVTLDVVDGTCSSHPMFQPRLNTRRPDWHLPATMHAQGGARTRPPPPAIAAHHRLSPPPAASRDRHTVPQGS